MMRAVPDGLSVFYLLVDDHNVHDISGRFFNCLSGERRFCSFSDFFLQAEQVMDQADFPQTVFDTRKMEGEDPDRGRLTEEDFFVRLERRPQHLNPVELLKVPDRFGREESFVIRVRFRDHASWQGEVLWLHTAMDARFRSALELLSLIEDAVAGEEDNGESGRQDAPAEPGSA